MTPIFHQVDNIVAQESVFGWVLSGSWNVSFCNNFVSSQMLCFEGISDSELQSFWTLCSRELFAVTQTLKQ